MTDRVEVGDTTEVVIVNEGDTSEVVVQQPDDIETVYVGEQGPQGVKGEQGYPGQKGDQGDQGIQGPQGNLIIYGTSNPVAGVGVDGDSYINTSTNFLFGPKAAGAWPAGTSLVGPTGPTGPTGPVGPTAPRGYIAGLNLAAAASATSFSIGAGIACDSTGAVGLQLLSAYTKTTAAWAVGTGNGSIDTGTFQANKDYFIFVIRRSDTGVVDILMSLSPTAPTLPTNYSQFRRIGALASAGTAVFQAVTQFGDYFRWITPPLDWSSLAVANTPTLYSVSAPVGIITEVRCVVDVVNTTNALAAVWVQDGDGAGVTAGSGRINVGAYCAGTSNRGFGEVRVRTDLTGKIYASSFTPATTLVNLSTIGWYDRRGRDD